MQLIPSQIELHTALSVPEGDGVTVKRLMPIHGLRNFDPFVLWDHFDISGAGFPDHPHRGFEAITYLFAGGMRHTDNLGNAGTVQAGGAQAFTAGRGLVHSEMPDGHAAGIQLWINLPKRLKGIAPAYQQFAASDIPEHSANGILTRTIVGESGPVQLHATAEYLDIQMKSSASLTRHVPETFRGLIYVVNGEAVIAGQRTTAGQACYIDGIGPVSITTDCATRLMWCMGRPHGEPIHQHGPFVD